jgi:hypothetical protein
MQLNTYQSCSFRIFVESEIKPQNYIHRGSSLVGSLWDKDKLISITTDFNKQISFKVKLGMTELSGICQSGQLSHYP